ncbi:uncharacterized protein M421DRAFT_427059 [Didymella exigua CBS 183.55]|uniref:Subtilisin-like serine protease n=1 Tax=Didymella exigua CBS 183.55 TaxID=1150837 RepID=A0A6A5R3T1_9PLEO|nr:uncharacterized protein M421DRAFT_427059 [Didymella exigua CBS 183.55]KAF1922312.1 hypothetical protein M421DRAFT_427059 [Didymella exigua CBS 183.55]
MSSSNAAMPPFSEANQLVRNLVPKLGAAQSETLPGQPSIPLKDFNRTKKFLDNDLWSDDLERMAPRLWILTTMSSANINSLHRQRVKGREIIVTEEIRLHLVWIHDRIFIKPIPRYLLSYGFWEAYLDRRPELLTDERNLRKAAAGFLRTYRCLIRHESDFHLAQQDSLRLIPKDVDWASFCRFTSDLNDIEDSAVSRRYCFGELRLTRLNFYAPLLLRKLHFEQVHGQYSDQFARLYGPVLFVFAVVSTILNSMQVALAADQSLTVPWVSVWHASRWFSVISIVGTAVVALCFVVLWLWMFLDEWVYTVKQKWKARRALLNASRC